MGRDGIAFVALMLVVAFLANQILSILFAIVSIIGTLSAAALFFYWLKGGSNNPTIQKWTAPTEMNPRCVPNTFTMLGQFILHSIQQPGDNADSLMDRYILRINAHDGNGPIPDYLCNAVVKKMLWEYKQLNGNLTMTSARNPITADLVMRPLEPTEVTDFHRFCLEHTL